MKDNKLKLQETRAITVVDAFETVSFGLSYLCSKLNNNQNNNNRYGIFPKLHFFSIFLSVFVKKSSQKQKNIIFALQIIRQADNCV